jgi:DNA-binding response OmpR family regulator
MTWGSTQIAKPDEDSAPEGAAPREAGRKALRAVLVDERSERRALTRRVVDLALGTGTVVAEVMTVAEALIAVGRHSADVVVLELRTPLIEWLAGIAELRATDPTLAIVVCTFRADLATRFQACDAGADSYLVKPVSARDLRSALESRQTGPAAHATNGRAEPPTTLS